MLSLHVPTLAELAVRQAWLADPEMMAYNAGWDIASPGYDRGTGCIDWPQAEWPAFVARLRRPLSECGYYYVRDEAGADLGHAHYELDDHGRAHLGINVVPSHRGQGLGSAFLRLLLERVWVDTPAREAVNEFEDEREAAVRTHERLGFRPDTETRSAYGRPTRVWRLARQGRGA